MIKKKKDKKNRKHRTELTLLVSAIVFVDLLFTVMLSGLIVYLLVKYKVVGDIEDITLSTSEIIIMLCTISLILGAVFSSSLTSILLKPINSIIFNMNRLAAGDFKTRLKAKGPFAKLHAMQEVKDSFNQMAEELECTEVLRNDFVNNFSHEFKTPIVSIYGFAKLLKKGNLAEEQKKEYIEIIEQESARLSTMATNVLNLTKYENQTILTDVARYNLSEQIRGSILALEGKWNKKNIDFNIDFDEYMITANQDILSHVWINLIDNAIKFSDEGGQVEINISDEGDIYKIVISNDGKEMTEEQKKRIFNKFYQADESHASKGNGVGLALAKKSVELHEGEIYVETINGKVSFYVELPIEQVI